MERGTCAFAVNAVGSVANPSARTARAAVEPFPGTNVRVVDASAAHMDVRRIRCAASTATERSARRRRRGASRPRSNGPSTPTVPDEGAEVVTLLQEWKLALDDRVAGPLPESDRGRRGPPAILANERKRSISGRKMNESSSSAGFVHHSAGDMHSVLTSLPWPVSSRSRSLPWSASSLRHTRNPRGSPAGSRPRSRRRRRPT